MYVDEINADETELLEKYKVLEVDYQNGTLNKITDINQLSVLIPLFQEALSKYN